MVPRGQAVAWASMRPADPDFVPSAGLAALDPASGERLLINTCRRPRDDRFAGSSFIIHDPGLDATGQRPIRAARRAHSGLPPVAPTSTRPSRTGSSASSRGSGRRGERSARRSSASARSRWSSSSPWGSTTATSRTSSISASRRSRRIGRATEKIGARNRAGLVRYALHRGLAPGQVRSPRPRAGLPPILRRIRP